MIFKLISCLSIILTVHGNEVKEKYAVSTQSFNRPDIPLSYEFTNVHNYKREFNPERDNHRISGLKRYPVIQYAPLNYEIKSEDSREQQNIRPHESQKPDAAVLNTGRHVYTGQEKRKHLEPKPLREDNVNQQNYRSFISGHNVEAEAYSETTGHYVEQEDPIVTRQDHYQKQKSHPQAKPAKFVYYQKSKDNTLIGPANVGTVNGNIRSAVEVPPTNRNYKFLEYLPIDYNSPIRNEHKKSLPYAYSLHDQLSQEKQQQTYAHPRIHLNIARNYNIGKQVPEAHLPPILSPKALTLTNLILSPQNTIMLPVRKGNSVLRL